MPRTGSLRSHLIEGNADVVRLNDEAEREQEVGEHLSICMRGHFGLLHPYGTWPVAQQTDAWVKKREVNWRMSYASSRAPGFRRSGFTARFIFQLYHSTAA